MNKNILIFTRPAFLPKYQILDADNKKGINTSKKY